MWDEVGVRGWRRVLYSFSSSPVQKNHNAVQKVVTRGPKLGQRGHSSWRSNKRVFTTTVTMYEHDSILLAAYQYSMAFPYCCYGGYSDSEQLPQWACVPSPRTSHTSEVAIRCRSASQRDDEPGTIWQGSLWNLLTSAKQDPTVALHCCPTTCCNYRETLLTRSLPNIRGTVAHPIVCVEMLSQ